MAWPNLPYGNGPGEWQNIQELLQSAANYNFASGQQMTINGTVCGNVANASSVDGNGNYSNTGTVNGTEWVGPTGPIHSTYTSQSFDCQWYTTTSGFPPGCAADPKNEPSDQLFVDIAIASNTAKALTPTQTFSGINTTTGNVTINVVSGLNVINIPPNPYGTTEGKLEVRGGGDLIISGPEDAIVIFNVGADNQVNAVRNGMSIQNGRSILTTGGVKAYNILFNVIGGDITINAGTVNGNILVRAGSDVKGKADIQQNSYINGIVIGDGNHSSEFSLDTNSTICGGFPSIDLVKEISIDNGVTWQDASVAPGPEIPSSITPQFRFTVTNTGTVTLENISVTDTFFGIVGLLPSLDPNQSFQWVITIPWQAGQHVNVATATGVYDQVTYTDTDIAYYFGVNPQIDIEKFISADNGVNWVDADTAPGPVIPSSVSPQFKFVVTNTGNVTMENINVTDDVYGNIGTLPSLTPGASFEWVTTETWTTGPHVNTATVTAEYQGTPYTDTDQAHYLGDDEPVPSIDIEKYVSADNGLTWIQADTAPGPNIPSSITPQFRFIIVNSGNVTLTDVIVTDDTLGAIGTIPIFVPGAVNEWILSDPWQEGQHANLATVNANYEGTILEDTDPSHYFGINPAIEVIKRISIDGGVTWLDADTLPGPLIPSSVTPQFQFIVTNTGNVTLAPVMVMDSNFGMIVNLVSLDPGQSDETIITVPWQPDQHENTATATGFFNGIIVQDTDLAYYFGINPAIEFVKLVSPDNGVTWLTANELPGPIIPSSIAPQFRFIVKNTGNVTLTNIVVTDNVFGAIGTVPSLLPLEHQEWFITVPWEAGQHVNIGTASGEYEGETYIVTDPAYYFGANPAIEIIKYVSVDEGMTWVDANTSPGPYLPPGTNPYFRFVVTNTGDVTLTNITVTDSVLGLIGTLPSINPGDTFEWIIPT